MRDTVTFFAAMFAVTALAEFAVLRRRVGHRGYAFCVLSVSFISGVAWLVGAVSLFYIRSGWKAAQEPPISGAEWVVVGLFSVVDVLILTAVELIPAGGVALIYIYRRRRNRRDSAS